MVMIMIMVMIMVMVMIMIMVKVMIMITRQQGSASLCSACIAIKFSERLSKEAHTNNKLK